MLQTRLKKGLGSGRSIQLENNNAFMKKNLKRICDQYCPLSILCHGGRQANGFKTSASNTYAAGAAGVEDLFSITVSRKDS